MDQIHTPEVCDYRQYDRIWQRVAPTLEPYPGMGQSVQAETASENRKPTTADAANGMTALPSPQVRQEPAMPGADPNPCCMGSAAAEMLGVLTGFIEEELEDRRQYLALGREAPPWARQQLREMAAEEGEHARRLMAVHYLITGACYRPNVHCGQICWGGWCAALRERYHDEACGGLNYARAADGTADVCLAGLLRELSADEYRHAEELLTMLERSMQRC